MQRILLFIQILISCWEVWICYELLYSTILEKEYLRKKDKALIYGNILIWGGLLAYNHRFAFFSRGILYTSIAVTGLCVGVVVKRNIILVIGMVTLYYSLVAALDFFVAFSSMYYLRESGIDFEKNVYSSSTYIQAILLFMARWIMFMAVMLIKRRLNLHKRELERYAYPILAMSMILLLIIKRYQFDLSGMASGIQEAKGGFTGTSLIFLVSMVLLVSIGLLINDSVRKQNEILTLRDEMQNNWYQSIQDELDLERIRVHDVKQHFIVLQAYEKEKDWGQLHQYLEKIAGQFSETKMPVCTGNRIMDLVLYHKKQEAEQKNIEWKLHAVKLQNLPMEEHEIVSFMGNLLDNAIEACERMEGGKKWILIRISRQKQILNIEISNSIGQAPKEKDGELISSKENKKRHGYGSKSVRRIVERHEGEIFYRIQERQFCVRVTFFDMDLKQETC